MAVEYDRKGNAKLTPSRPSALDTYGSRPSVPVPLPEAYPGARLEALGEGRERGTQRYRLTIHTLHPGMNLTRGFVTEGHARYKEADGLDASHPEHLVLALLNRTQSTPDPGAYGGTDN